MSEVFDAHPRFAELSESVGGASAARHTVLLDPGERVLEVEELELVADAARLVLPARRATIGAASASDLCLRDPTVSRHHAEVIPTDAGPLLVDLGSRNGIKVGGRRVPRVHLSAGLVVTLGKVDVTVHARTRRERVGEAADGIAGIVAASAAMQRVVALVNKLAPLSCTVLIHGESGTGKEALARALHEKSSRAAGPWVVLDGGAVPRTLAEAELFGHEKGAFTGADVARPGAFERAEGGTLFLDEIGELPLELQPKLLRALEAREVRRVGAAAPRTVDVRVVAATHRDLRAEVRAGRFRPDLFHRLVVVELRVPPLRDRPEDVRAIAEALARDPKITGGRVSGISDVAMERLLSHAWPGNARELVNVIRAASALAPASMIGLPDLPSQLSPYASLDDVVRDAAELDFKAARDRVLAAFEADYLARVLRATRGNVSEAARRTGIHRKTIERMVRRHGLDARVLGGRDPRDE